MPRHPDIGNVARSKPGYKKWHSDPLINLLLGAAEISGFDDPEELLARYSHNTVATDVRSEKYHERSATVARPEGGSRNGR